MNFEIHGKSFGAHPVLGRISLPVEAGDIIALLGPSGCGKSTLLRIVAGLDHDNAHTRQPAPTRAMVFQEPYLLPWKTLAENVALAGPTGSPLLAQLGLAASAGLYPRQISLGMARRVAIARALAAKPQLLIMDEPFASLDAETAALTRAVVMEEAKLNATAILIVTHDRHEAFSLASRVYQLSGAPSQLQQIHHP